MRVVSTKVKMVDSFSESEYFNIINKWLTEAGPCKAVAEQLEACADKIGVHLEAEYCTADTSRIEKDGKVYTLFRFPRADMDYGDYPRMQSRWKDSLFPH